MERDNLNDYEDGYDDAEDRAAARLSSGRHYQDELDEDEEDILY